MPNTNTITIDGIQVPIEGERNVLELIRKAGIDLPTFCYHSELSVYGACRLCLVDVEGRGLMGACSTPPQPGMTLRTGTEEIRGIRRMTVELLLANGHQDCPTCSRSTNCQLQSLAQRLGVERVRYGRTEPELPIDRTSPALTRDPNKCVLCGDCVRACSEIQGIGAIDFVGRGAQTKVMPAFCKNLDEVECVHCGQCARVCPTGALAVKSDVEAVWKAMDDAGKTLVVQIAPAVRVALGECFGLEPGTITTGQIAAALRRLGFAQVYDTSFAADLTVIEEANEFLKRKQAGEDLPQFTSCCPAWVQYAEQYCADLLPNLSSCRSPQQMFGSLAKEVLPEQLGIAREDLVVVSIMPCVAKKVEAGLTRFKTAGVPDVDFVLTTQELARMIKEAGIRFNELAPDRLDLPFGFKTGAGVIFGASGGVSEAVLRLAAEKLTGARLDSVDFHEVRGEDGIRETVVTLNGNTVRLAIVHSLKNAKEIVRRVRAGEREYDLIEVMACPGGCVGGAGQPISSEHDVRQRRAKGLYEADKMLQLHKSQDNHMVARCYEETLGSVGGEKAHRLLHTHYESRRRINGVPLPLLNAAREDKLSVRVCVGTNCHVKGSQKLLHELIDYINQHNLAEVVDVQATFCFENCGQAPNVAVGDAIIGACTLEKAVLEIQQELSRLPMGAAGT